MKRRHVEGAGLGVLLIAVPSLANAYIGPGLGAGAIAATLGVIGSLFLALFAVIYYPIKRMRKRMRAASEKKEPTTAPGE